MSKKILIADDSPTIQKVITITFASDPYKLSTVETVGDMMKKLESEEFDLVLLDFSLSDEKTGYELGAEIHQISQNVKILAMMGTFDTVDERLFLESTINDKIVKPFESQGFIQKCRSLLESTEMNISESEHLSADLEEDQVSLEIGQNDEQDDDDWTIESDNVVGEIELPSIAPENSFEVSEESSLKKEMKDWGVEVPGFISGASDDNNEVDSTFPPVIDKEAEQSLEDSQFFPADEDLSFPDESFVSEGESNSLTSKLVPLNELIDDDDEEGEESDLTDPFNVLSNIDENEEELVLAIEKEIDPNDFWAVDETVDDSATGEFQLEEIGGSIENPIISQEVDAFSTVNSTDVVNEKPTTASLTSNVSEDAIIAKLMERLVPILEEKMAEYCRDTVEKVSWEIIPDLAENLIRDEIKNISDQVTD